MWAIIGGSGFEKFDGFESLEFLNRETPFGLASSGLRRVRVNGQTAIFISRHGEHHELTPTEINYRANIFALKHYGATAVVSFSAVGSLREHLPPGHLVIPDQYIDRTKGLRKHSFGGDGIVSHASLAYPVCAPAAKLTEGLAKKAGLQVQRGGTYVCIEGPNFSTLAESLMYRDMKCDIIGMTNFPEYALAREAGLTYLPCCFITDFDCWDTSRPHVTIEEVIATMKQNNAKGFKVLSELVNAGDDWRRECHCAEQGFRSGLMTPREALSEDQKRWMQILLE